MTQEQPFPRSHKMSILGLCNPLLDISAKVPETLLEKYGLARDNAILAESKHLPLMQEIASMPNVTFVAGGAAQNTTRVAQWILGGSGDVGYMGCVGDDGFMKKMKESVESYGVNAMYMVDKSQPTGSCAVLLTNNGRSRSLVANLGAANFFKATHLKEHWDIVSSTPIVYCSGFFITSSPDSIELMSDHACKNNVIYGLNLSAPFIVEVPPFRDLLLKTLPKVDFLFGNDAEAIALAKAMNWEDEKDDVSRIALKLANWEKVNKNRVRHVVFTQGHKPTVVAIQGKSEVNYYPIVVLPAEKVIDTNGAGDAYVGGFLAGLACGVDIEECCAAGAYAASEVVQLDGCALPPVPKFKLSKTLKK